MGNAYKNKKTKKGKKRQNKPSEIRLSGVPPYNAYITPTKKTQGKINPQKYVYQEKKRENRPSEIRLSGKKKKKKRHNRHQEIRLSGVPPIMPIKNQQQKTQGKIDPQKYVYQEEKKRKKKGTIDTKKYVYQGYSL